MGEDCVVHVAGIEMDMARSRSRSLPEARVGGHGYSSRLVCLFVISGSAHLAATAFTAWIAFTQ